MKVSIIVPVFNESDSISPLLEKVIASPTLGFEKEIIVVNDGSSDDSDLKIKKHLPHIHKYISLECNKGKGHALRQGFLGSSGEIILVQDADLEYFPDDYQHLLAPFLNENADAVVGKRIMRDNLSKHYFSPYFWGGRTINVFFNLISGQKIQDIHAGYKLIKRQHWISLNLNSNGFDFCHEFLLKAVQKNLNIIEVPIRYEPRKFKQGKKIRMKDGVRALKTMLHIYFSSTFSKKRY